MLLYFTVCISPEDFFAWDLANQLSAHCRSVHSNQDGSDFLSRTKKNCKYVLGTKNRNCLEKRAGAIVC